MQKSFCNLMITVLTAELQLTSSIINVIPSQGITCHQTSFENLTFKLYNEMLK
ncbi:MAG: hypothetical protein ACM34N_05185 [Ignavibacteria bacterium]